MAVEEANSYVRTAAIKGLTNQSLLAKMAVDDKEDVSVRAVAVEQLTDQTVLAKVALKDKDIRIQLRAVKRLDNYALLASVATANAPSILRFMAINRLRESDPILKKLAFKTKGVTTDAGEYLARVKLAMLEPRIKSHFPDLLCSIKGKLLSQNYQNRAALIRVGSVVSRSMTGEELEITLSRAISPTDVQTLAKTVWETNFSLYTESSAHVNAKISGKELLEQLLYRSDFTAEDLADLSHSAIPEVAIGAVANTADQSILVKFALDAKDSYVRSAAVKNLSDQTVLARIASKDKDWKVRLVATEHLTDQAVLAKIAIKDERSDVSDVAITKLTDLVMLKKVVSEAKNEVTLKKAADRVKWLTSNK